MNISKQSYDLVISIEYSIADSDTSIAASSDFEQSIPNSVYGKYDAFIIKLEKKFRDAGFKIAENHGSNRPDSLSEYFAIYPADSDGNIVYTILIILRVSDHRLKRGKKHGYKYYNNYAQKQKYPKSKEYQDWEFEQILVNNHSASSYDEAIVDVEELISKWIDKSSNNALVSL